MGIAREGKIEEIGESFSGAFGGDAGRAHVAAQNLSNLQVKQMRGMQRLAGGKEDAADAASRRRLEQNLQNRGSVHNDQRLFLSPLTMPAGAGRGSRRR